ncbi:hypothetical protein CERSUDRAFT_117078 [Gelatoporia subvermispora B]|uniref:Uncharacterized protein n=1 Tax=Ceriporiopsis subvermispora (strain B) TaxID=914234 RepID=M2R715_CERS8|nr:hypothetical protein CERSUDRAFT_117078 [Gelatoporia subvermispora B]
MLTMQYKTERTRHYLQWYPTQAQSSPSDPAIRSSIETDRDNAEWTCSCGTVATRRFASGREHSRRRSTMFATSCGMLRIAPLSAFAGRSILRSNSAPTSLLRCFSCLRARRASARASIAACSSRLRARRSAASLESLTCMGTSPPGAGKGGNSAFAARVTRSPSSASAARAARSAASARLRTARSVRNSSIARCVVEGSSCTSRKSRSSSSGEGERASGGSIDVGSSSSPSPSCSGESSTKDELDEDELEEDEDSKSGMTVSSSESSSGSTSDGLCGECGTGVINGSSDSPSSGNRSSTRRAGEEGECVKGKSSSPRGKMVSGKVLSVSGSLSNEGNRRGGRGMACEWPSSTSMCTP